MIEIRLVFFGSEKQELAVGRPFSLMTLTISGITLFTLLDKRTSSTVPKILFTSRLKALSIYFYSADPKMNSIQSPKCQRAYDFHLRTALLVDQRELFDSLGSAESVKISSLESIHFSISPTEYTPHKSFPSNVM